MGSNMVATVKIMPEGVETDLETIKKTISEVLPQKTELHDTKEEPIAFGLRALIARILLPDEGGVADAIEKGIGEIEGVREVSIDDVRRLL